MIYYNYFIKVFPKILNNNKEIFIIILCIVLKTSYIVNCFFVYVLLKRLNQ